MSFGERLRSRRKHLKLTQKQLAHLIGSGQSLISMYESEHRHPLPAETRQLAKALKTSTDYLHSLTDDPEPLTDDERELIAAFRRRDVKRINELLVKKARKDMWK